MAQCDSGDQCSITPPTGILPLQLNGSTATIDDPYLSNHFSALAECGYPGNDYTFLVFTDPPVFTDTEDPNDRVLGCGDVMNSPLIFYVVMEHDDEGTPGEYDGCDALAVEIQIELTDNNPPQITCPTGIPSSISSNFDGENDDDCTTKLNSGVMNMFSESTTNPVFPADQIPNGDYTGDFILSDLVTSEITLPGAGSGIPSSAVISSIEIDVSMWHGWVDDLVMFLEAPNGEILGLVNNPAGGSGNIGFVSNFAVIPSTINFNDALSSNNPAVVPFTCPANDNCSFMPNFNAAAPASIASQFHVNFASLIASFATADEANGAWKLHIGDYATHPGSISGGRLTSWSINIEFEAPLFHPTPTDNCPDGSTTQLDVKYENSSAPVTTVMEDDITPGTENEYEFHVGTTTVTYTATDANGLMSTCDFTVTVADDEAPTWNLLQTVMIPDGSTVTTGTLPGSNTSGNLATGFRFLDVEIECQDDNFTDALDYWMNDFLPQATDNCADPVSVEEDGAGFNLNAVDGCETINGHDDVKRRFNRRFKANDGTNFIGVATGDQFALRIFIVDRTGPDFSDNAVTMLSGYDEDTKTLTLNLSDYYDGTLATTPCELTTGASFAAPQINAAPSLAVLATECSEGSLAPPSGENDDGVFYTGWTVDALDGAPDPVTTDDPDDDSNDNNADQTYEVGSYEIEYTAEDLCGNESTFKFTLEVVDDIGPALTLDCPATIEEDADDGECEKTITWAHPTAMDNCSGSNITVTAQGMIGSQVVPVTMNSSAGMDLAEFPVGTTTVTYTFKDELNNETTCDFDVIVSDDQAPEITCGANLNLNTICENQEVPVYTGNIAVLTDNCIASSPPTISQSPTTSVTLEDIFDDWDLGNGTNTYGFVDNDGSESLSQGDQFDVTLTATQGSLTDNCTFTVTMFDLDEPTPDPAVLGNITPSTTVGATCGTLVVPAPIARDCDDNIIYGEPNLSNGLVPGDPNAPGYHPAYYFSSSPFAAGLNITWTYDDGPNEATLTQFIQVVEDGISPVVNAPQNILAAAPLYTDDECEATLDLSLVDLTGTSSTLPLPTPGNGEMIDNCDIVSLQYTLSGATMLTTLTDVTATPVTFEKGETIVTYTATDSENNSGNSFFIVTVVDNVKPRLFINQSHVTLYLDDDDDAQSGDCNYALQVSDYDISPADNCDDSPTKKIIAWSASNDGTITPDPVDATSLSGLTFNLDTEEGNDLFSVRWEVEDEDGNFKRGWQEITIIDEVEPTLSCLGDALRYVDGNCEYIVDGDELDIAVSSLMDNCDVKEYSNSINGSTSLDDESFGIDNSPYTIVWTVEDYNGNTNTCSMVLTIEDNTEPAFNCLNINRPLPSNGVLNLTWEDFVFGTPSDNCDLPEPMGTYFSLSRSTFTCDDADGNSIDIVITMEDEAGNVANCTSQLTIQESVAPTVICESITESLAGSSVTIQAEDLNNGSFDNCPVNTPSLVFWFDVNGTLESELEFDCSQTGDHDVEVIAEDANGNLSSPCSATITIVDDTPPVVVCQDLALPLDGVTEILTVTADQFVDSSSDNCPSITYLINGMSSMSFSCAQVGTPIAITLEASDGVNTPVSCSATLTVLDETDPDADCQDQTVYLDASGSATITADQFNLNSSDNVCSGTSLTYSFIGGATSQTVDCNNIGTNPITIEVQDQNGNTSQCTPNLTVLPNNEVEFTASNESGATGSTLTVEVSVDNFFEVGSFQFPGSIDPAIATITSIDVSSALIGIGAFADSFDPLTGEFFVAWASSPSVNLNDDDVVFTITVQLVATVLNEFSIVDLDDSQPAPNAFEVSQGCALIPAETSGILNDGSVQVGSANATISGYVKTENGQPVKYVDVVAADAAMNGNVIVSDQTDDMGYYELLVPAGTEVWVIPTKDINHKNGVTALDGAICQAAGAGLPVLQSGYKRLAGDVNASSSVTALDGAIIQFVVVTLDATFHNAPAYDVDSWQFVDADHVFVIPTNPWNAPYPSTLYYASAVTVSDQDFVGIKTGDVNTSGDPINQVTGDGDSRGDDDLYFQVEDQAIAVGDEIVVPFLAKDFNDVLAFQTTFEFDQNVLEYTGFTTGVLENLNSDVIGLANVADGWIGMAWFEAQSMDVADEEVLFTLTFTAKENATKLSDILELGSSIAEPAAYDGDYDTNELGLEFFGVSSTGVVSTHSFELMQNKPNPFKGTTLVGFTLPNATSATISVMDVTGKVVWFTEGDYSRGYNEVTIDRSDLPVNGIYYYQLKTTTDNAVKKMNLMD